jgi:uncharacterized membrane protein (UPF0127 family)
VIIAKTMGRLGLVRPVLGLALLAVTLAGSPVLAQKPKLAPSVAARPSARLDTVEILTLQGRAKFTVELAISPAEQQRGLMLRKALAPDRGMLFPCKPPRRAAFWMKNTLIPLDIIYIAPDGRVLSIARNAVPHDETPIPSGGVVGGVLEIAGGRAAQLGILPGDRVLNKIFPKG